MIDISQNGIRLHFNEIEISHLHSIFPIGKDEVEIVTDMPKYMFPFKFGDRVMFNMHIDSYPSIDCCVVIADVKIHLKDTKACLYSVKLRLV